MTRRFSLDCFSSEVHKAIQKATGGVVALKRILMHNEKEGMPVTALREIKILKALNHPCIIDIVDMIVVRSKLAFFPPVTATHTLVNRSRQGISLLCAYGFPIYGP